MDQTIGTWELDCRSCLRDVHDGLTTEKMLAYVDASGHRQVICKGCAKRVAVQVFDMVLGPA